MKPKEKINKISLTYTLSQSIKSMFKNSVMSLASILVLASCLVVLGTFGLLISNFNHNMADLTLLNEVVAFVDYSCDDNEIEEIRNQILSLREKGLVNDVEYISKEQALEEEMYKFKDYPYLFDSIKEGDNPYRASFVITYNDEALLNDLEYNLYSISVQRDGETLMPVEKVSSHAEIASSMKSMKDGVTKILLGFMLILLVVSLFIIINTIRLSVFSRRKEISVMQYVGATNSFIAAPFIAEGFFMGLISSIIAFLVQWLIYSRVRSFIVSNYRIFDVIPFKDNALILALTFLIVGLLAGISGSLISLAKYLKEN